MQPLEKTLRNQLERTVKTARDIAEVAAQAALGQLGVGEATAFAHLGDKDRELRRKLRVHGRQLGDVRDAVMEKQETSRLVEEIAYEHWHRMLFARFLAENNLLMYPDPDDPVAVTLEECDDLAADEGAVNGWELAARFAARMLPQIFRLDSPAFQLTLPPEHQQNLEQLLTALPVDVFTASDSLGWVYQFWQANNKEKINKSEVKIGARELPAVTQLFTEPYMVSFLLDNSLGAWWAARRLTESDLKNASNEEELRLKAAISGVPLEYLRFVQVEDTDGNKKWTPAAGTFDAWPKHLNQLKTLDPCCGSGHFLVAALLMLVPMRMELEDLTAQEAVDAVFRENIHGLELDQRCVELAAFALALTAWKYPAAGGYRPLPELHIACSGLSVSVAKEKWKKLGLGKKNLSMALEWMHDTFNDAPVLGSLLNPAKADAAKLVQWDELSGALEQALSRDNGQEQFAEQQEAAVVAQGISKAATLLARQYQWVITNVPYLSRGKQSERLRDFCEQHYPAAKNDLATVFLERCLQLCVEGGTSSIVLPQNWLFLTSYKKFRQQLLNNDTWHLLARLGAGAFETISGEVVKAILITLSRGSAQMTPLGGDSNSLFSSLRETTQPESNLLRGVDVSQPRTAAEKAAGLVTAEMKSVEQSTQINNPDSIVSIDTLETKKLLGVYCSALAGCFAGDTPQFIRSNWEVTSYLDGTWRFHQGSVSVGCHFYGQCEAILWENERGTIYKLAQSVKHLNHAAQNWLRGKPSWDKPGIIVSQMGELHSTIYTGEIYDTNCCAVIPKDHCSVSAIWAYAESGLLTKEVRRINQKINVTAKTILNIPFDIDHWTKVAAEKYPNGLPKPYTNDPTQWIFHGHPCGSVVWDEQSKWTAHSTLRTDDSVLQIAVARLLGYRWPAELDTDMELADEQREWVNRCEALLPYADDDGIVCIPAVRGEAAATDRLLNLLAASYGDAWSNDIQTELLKNAAHAGKTLETWLREKFFTQHCKMFGHRPFIWHIWDGLSDGFAALVNYHKLDYKTLETLTYNYLGQDWIGRQKQEIADGIDGAQERLAAAEALKKKLELILAGESPNDIFVRWKPLDQQPIGWNPDFNDGVRLNIRPFLTVGDVKKKGAGILRDKPNIKWGKDRGKDVESAPWYHLGPKYGGKDGDRINDHHLSLNEKRTAREVYDKEAKNG